MKTSKKYKVGDILYSVSYGDVYLLALEETIDNRVWKCIVLSARLSKHRIGKIFQYFINDFTVVSSDE